jgi:hypothetical protein
MTYVMDEAMALVGGDVAGDMDNEDPDELTDSELTDDELTALAMAAEPDLPLGPDAVPLVMHQSGGPEFLPAWYMPPVMARGAARWRRSLVYLLIAAFLLVDAFGLCITYGQLVAA